MTRGPLEVDFVHSALAETMATAYAKTRGRWKSRSLPDLRTAASRFALERVATASVTRGILP